MYRLLIVDDEPIIVNGLVDFFSQLGSWPLEVYGAFSAEEALGLLKQTRMDIVISDIGMPEMDGLELHKRILRQWPRCKVIFLTGFNDFGYIQEALRHQGFDYVLKAEGDDAVLGAVEKAIAQTSEEIRKEELLQQADRQMRLALPSLQKELLRNILQGDLYAVTRLGELFAELQMPLDAGQPILAVLVRVDNFRQDYSIYDRSLLVYNIQNVAMEYLQESVLTVQVEMDRARMMWMIQPKPEAQGPDRWKDAASFVRGCLELIQTTCRELLGTPLSFIMKDKPVQWSHAEDLYEEYNRLLSRGLGMGKEFLQIYGEAPTLHSQSGSPFHSGQLASRIDQLRLHLQNGRQDAFDAVFAEIKELGARFGGEPPILQEIYYSLVPVFLAQMNRLDAERPLRRFDLGRLASMDAHSSWEEAAAYLEELTAALFAEGAGGLEQEENGVVHKIQKYVLDHLDGDLSLVRIGDTIGHNSKYLSRLYKKNTGEDLSAFISRAKLARAQELLKESTLKIYEVSAAVGFLSEPYFYRFFRKAAGMTPQEYRELHGG